jgi:hypothetical protein
LNHYSLKKGILHKLFSFNSSQYLSMCGGQECGYELKKYQFITNGFICIPLGCFGLLRDRWYFGESFFFCKTKDNWFF